MGGREFVDSLEREKPMASKLSEAIHSSVQTGKPIRKYTSVLNSSAKYSLELDIDHSEQKKFESPDTRKFD